MTRQSNFLKEIVAIRAVAAEVFGSTEKAERWMNTYNLVLNAPPVDLLNSEVGINELKKILNAIKYGGVV